MMKPRNQKYMILAGVQSHISLLREVEEMRAGQLGTTIYDGDLKDWGGSRAESAKDQYK
jgi:hypothetical protein